MARPIGAMSADAGNRMSLTAAAQTLDLMRAEAAGAPRDIAAAIGKASQRTGVDFSYLVNQARQESSFRPEIRASTSSATGLYQFIDQTWLATVKAHGASHGLGEYAERIRTDSGGRHRVDDPVTRRAILDLRKDPQIAALMAAEHARENGEALQAAMGRAPTATDLYMAHFLGVEGAKTFLRARDADASQPAADLLPRAAHANRGVFYAPDGTKRSLGEVYDRFAAKFDESGEAPALLLARGDRTPMEQTVLAGGGSAGNFSFDPDRSGNSILTRSRLGGGGAGAITQTLKSESFLALAALQEVAAEMGAAPARAAKS